MHKNQMERKIKENCLEAQQKKIVVYSTTASSDIPFLFTLERCQPFMCFDMKEQK